MTSAVLSLGLHGPVPDQDVCRLEGVGNVLWCGIWVSGARAACANRSALWGYALARVAVLPGVSESWSSWGGGGGQYAAMVSSGAQPSYTHPQHRTTLPAPWVFSTRMMRLGGRQFTCQYDRRGLQRHDGAAVQGLRRCLGVGGGIWSPRPPMGRILHTPSRTRTNKVVRGEGAGASLNQTKPPAWLWSKNPRIRGRRFQRVG